MPETKIRIKEMEERLPYRLRENFMSAPELALYRVLVELVERHYIVCPKVALNDIFYIVRPNENVNFFNKIFRKHIDFLLCEPSTFKPAFGVDLVKPIAKSETRETDQFMEDLFISAGIPLVHIPTSEQYRITDLVELFKFSLVKIKQTGTLRTAAEADSVPMCPVCGRMMVLRMHRNGSLKGKMYYGCMDSPKCSGVAEIN